MKSFLIHLLILFAIPCLSQQELHLNLSNSCRHDGQGLDVRIFGWESSNEAKNKVRRICDAVGLQPRFDIRQASVPNAMATIQGNKRLILYSENFILKINQSTGTGWASTGILAHEIGHHLNNHTLAEEGSRPELELEADEFSGFVLARLGATLEQAQAAIQTVSARGSSTHPPRQARLEAIARGWRRSGGGSPQADSDGDQVPDGQDDCPTEYGTINSKGCPDYDNDGIPNKNDECPYEAGAPERRGCPEPVVVDSDNDGVPDVSDKCKFSKGLARFEGCPDSDGDNLPDHVDKCPNEKGMVRNDGCPTISHRQPNNMEKNSSLRTITGTVTDIKEGWPLIGLNIVVIGTSSGTITDIDGTYSLDVPSGFHSIEFRYTGYRTIKTELGASNVLDVSLKKKWP